MATLRLLVGARLRLLVLLVVAAAAVEGQDRRDAQPTRGPLQVHRDNPRYFADATGKAILLTGAHTWNNLVDIGPSDPPEAFDFPAYLDFLDKHGHNFIRLWAWDSVTWDTRANGESTLQAVNRAAPQPWARTGPGTALDGKPKFDLEKFNDEYFRRLRDRVSAAGQRGKYVSIMLFEGWGLMHGNRRRGTTLGWAWSGHPLHPDNNINGVGAGLEKNGAKVPVHSRANPAVNAVQAAYIRKVVDTVNDLDNVLYEVINEGGEKEWDWWVVETIRAHERNKPQQHLIGITGHGAENLASMLASPADWISPGSRDGYRDDPPAWNGKSKVSVLDTDHIWGLGGHPTWAWKAFVRGHNPIFMDPYDNSLLAKGSAESWNPLRQSLGVIRRVAERVDLAAMKPHGELASSEYCLAELGRAYIAFAPDGQALTLDLTGHAGTLRAEWIHPVTGDSLPAGEVPFGAKRRLAPPRGGYTVLLLHP